MLKTVVFAGALLGLGACASTYEAPQSRIDPETGQQITVLKANEIPNKMVEVNEDGEELICRTDSETGSRIKKRRICGTQAQWDSLDQANQQFSKDMQRRDPFRNE